MVNAHLSFRTLTVWFALISGLASPAFAVNEDLAPEAASKALQSAAKSGQAKRAMAVTANPYATRAATEVLRRGGSAVDATVAAAMVLTLVEPQSSGIGGGGFLLRYDFSGRIVQALDGRETAPQSAHPDRFMKTDGSPMGFWEAVPTGLSIGVPSLLPMLDEAHRRHGKLPWASLIEPAITLAEQGFPLSPRLYGLLSKDKLLRKDPTALAHYYQSDGTPYPVGTKLKNPKLAQTLRLIASKRSKALSEGPLAEAILATVNRAPKPGGMTLADLQAYKVKVREAVCMPYRLYKVCGMPPPSSGGLTALQMLGLLEPFDLKSLTPRGATAVHLMAEAGRLAYADRNHYIADDAFVQVPAKGLLDKGYLQERGRLIRASETMGKASPGTPPGAKTAPADASNEKPGTSHLSIVDSVGNVVSMTASIENAFGARRMVGGFLLNNQLTDFSFRPDKDGQPIANRVEPGKKPRSSMAPTLVLDHKNRFVMATGSPGGSRIIPYTVQTILGVLDWGMTAQQAVSAPHALNRNGATELEADRGLEKLQPTLEHLGHEVKVRPMVSGLSVIVKRDGVYEGAADPRREGTVGGF